MMDLPPDDAYGRVTDATRYQVVVQTAVQLIDELTASYQVELRKGGPELDPELCEGLLVDRVVRLEPSSEDAASLTIVVTTFPGVAIRAGRWRTALYPTCGWDACDELPDELAEDLARQLRAVAAGRLVEELRGGLDPHRTVSLSDETGPLGTQLGSISRREMEAMGGPARYDWRPWPLRSERRSKV
jgi:hypothetical protein